MIKFLDKEMLLVFHKDLVKIYGGEPGVRDDGLLESALAQPKMSFGGKYAHKNIFEMAAAYGFHICMNHPFYDGNKRTALVAVYTFLFVNGYRLNAEKKSLYAIMMNLASGKVDKKELAYFLKGNCEERK